MSENITLTVPLVASVLKRTAEYCTQLAADLSGATTDEVPAVIAAPPAVEPPATIIAHDAPPPPAAVVVTNEIPWNPEILDGEGRPWDARIHAGTKTKYSKPPHGFKKKRGATDAEVTAVHAEMLAAGFPASTPAVEPPPVVAAPPAAAPPVVAAPPAAAPPITAAPPPVVAAPPAVAPVLPARTQADLMQLMSAYSADPVRGINFVTAIPAILAPHGIATVADLAGRPDLLPTIYKEFEDKWVELSTPG